jgi:hypothetical protein
MFDTPPALEIALLANFPEETTDLLDKGQRPLLVLDWLLAEEKYVDAIRFLSQGLPHREAIWWACLCVQLAGLPPFTEAERATLAACVRWVLEPADDLRRRAYEASSDVKEGRPVRMLAQAVFQSGGSLLPPGQPEYLPQPNACGNSVTGTVVNAALKGKTGSLVERYRLFLAVAIALLQSQPPPPASARATRGVAAVRAR